MMLATTQHSSQELFLQNCRHLQMRGGDVQMRGGQLQMRGGMPAYRSVQSSSLEYDPACLPTLRFEGKYLYNRYEPYREIEEQLEIMKSKSFDSILLCGMGTGIFVPILKNAFPQYPIIGVEMNESLFLTLLASHDFRKQKELRSMPILLRPDAKQLLQYLSSLPSYTPYLLHTRISLSFFGEEFQKLCNEVNTYTRNNAINKNTLRRFSNTWKSNIIKNAFRHSDAMLQLAPFKGALRGMNAMLCAAGPSLDAHIETVRAGKKKMPLIAVDTALPALKAQNLVPDYIVTVDPQVLNSQHFNWYRAHSTHEIPMLVLDIACSSRALRLCKDLPFLVMPPFISLGNVLLPEMNRQERLQTGGSVAQVAWNFACFAGIAKLYTVGMDFCYWGMRTHSRYALPELTPLLHASRLRSREQDNYTKIHSTGSTSMTNYTGAQVPSSSQLAVFASCFAEHCKEFNTMQTFSFEPGAAEIAGVTLVSDDVLQALPSSRDEFMKLTSGLHRESEQRSGQRALHQLQSYAASIRQIEKKLQETLEASMTDSHLHALAENVEQILRSEFFESIEFFLQFEDFSVRAETGEEGQAFGQGRDTGCTEPAKQLPSSHKLTQVLQKLLHECHTLQLSLMRILGEEEQKAMDEATDPAAKMPTLVH